MRRRRSAAARSIAQSRGPVLALTLVLAGTLFGGFINLIHLGPYYPATMMIDGLCVVMFLRIVLAAADPKTHIPFPPWLLALSAMALIYLVLALVSPEPLVRSLLSFRSEAFYAVVGVYAYAFVQGEDRQRLIDRAMWMSMVVAAFGITQVILGNLLPAQLLASKDTELFGYFGTDIHRANGLVGNTIVYGSILSLFYALHLARWLTRPNLVHFGSTLLIFGAIMATYSRVAILSAAVIGLAAVVVVAARKNFVKLVLGTALLAFCLPVFAWLLWPAFFGQLEDSFLVRGLFQGQNASVQASNAGHVDDIRIAREAFAEHPWTGVGIATNSEGSEYARENDWISDGATWTKLAEGGLILVAPYAVLVVVLIWTCVRRWNEDRHHWPAIGLAAFIAFQFSVASMYNSAVFGKPTFLLLWILFGLVARRTRAPSRSRTASMAVRDATRLPEYLRHDIT